MTLWQILPVSYLALATLPLLIHDIRTHRLPNVWVFPGWAVVVISWLGMWGSSGDFPVISVVSAGGYFLFMVVLSSAGGLGMGDVKLAFVLGAVTGMFGGVSAVLSPVLAFVLGGIVSVGILATTHVSSRAAGVSSWSFVQQRRIAFGPFMLLGAWGALGVHWVAANVLG